MQRDAQPVAEARDEDAPAQQFGMGGLGIVERDHRDARPRGGIRSRDDL